MKKGEVLFEERKDEKGEVLLETSKVEKGEVLFEERGMRGVAYASPWICASARITGWRLL